ncbi:tetratricopeptide repeat protein [Pseudomonas lundensis]|uniref:tetratricopeptide repeat protein n=1 Tax=Pseudomonas lundensis TaxID=86185 RepID=UPI00089DACF7|nr:tetratricopeptide repeat protein [Pseudomonas lundensis]
MPISKRNAAPEPPALRSTPITRYVFPLTAGLLLLVVAGLWLYVSRPHPVVPVAVAPTPRAAAPATPKNAPAQWVDEQQCQGCHSVQVKDWQGSHHQLAMQEADAHTVLADFSGVTFKAEGESSRFFRKNDGFWVNTLGVNGQPADFKVAYTFGVAPLQQYLIDVGDGKLQALGVAWDTEKNTWFHLYPGQGVDFKNPLHWSKPSQNANFMCIECHTTGFKRNFDAVQNTFNSQWNSLGVGCQACHGPASNHLLAVTSHHALPQSGFDVDLKHTDATTEIETCARCHARRAPLGDGFSAEKTLMDDYLPSVLTRELYALDGKINDEVFEHGSFLQSKMFDKGVRCSNCHNPHTSELKAPGNGVCLQCHNPAGKTALPGIEGNGLQAKDYESTAHHKHAEGQPGAQCVDCHMPGKVYMGNDYRHDHSFSVPNPVRAKALGTPDACLSCHQGKAGDKVIEQFRLWTADAAPQPARYDESLALIRAGKPGAARALYQQLRRSNLPAIQRATLLAELAVYPGDSALSLATADLSHPQPQVRESAVRAVSALLPPAERVAVLTPLLNDRVRAVRIIAARHLLGAAREGLGASQNAWATAINEYETVQLSLLERAEANLNLAMLYQASGRRGEVEPKLRDALVRDPDFYPALVTLGQWLESTGRGAEANELLSAAIRQHPTSALLRHTQGLALIRAGQPGQAMAELKAAVKLEPDTAQFRYVLAVALQGAGQTPQACEQLEALLARQPAHREARLSLIQFYLDSGQEPKAHAVLQGWKAINPDDPALK